MASEKQKGDEQQLSADEKTRLADLRAKRAKLAEQKSKREAEAAAKRLIPDEERELANDEAIEAAEAQYGPSFVFPDEKDDEESVGKKIAVVRTALGVVIVRRPAHQAFRRFQNAPKSTDKEATDLIETCLVYPEKPAFRELVSEQPAVLFLIANAASRLAGWRSSEVAGKA